MLGFLLLYFSVIGNGWTMMKGWIGVFILVKCLERKSLRKVSVNIYYFIDVCC